MPQNTTKKVMMKKSSWIKKALTPQDSVFESLESYNDA